MLALVIGGAASGKSEFAERLAMSWGEERYYIATMQAYDAESERRVARHQQMRRGKGFTTLERPLDLAGSKPEVRSDNAVALLECASTLLGNELSLPGGAGAAAWQVIAEGVERLHRRGLAVVVVSNDVFLAGGGYSPEMTEYLRQLGLLNRRLAALADQVFEVVCGLPLCHKE